MQTTYSGVMSKSISKDRVFGLGNHERWEFEDKKFSPAKLLKKFEKLLTNIDPAQLASRFLNSFMPTAGAGMLPNVTPGLGVTPITASDITVTGYAVTTTSGLSGLTPTAVANVEVGFDLTGTAYQSLINGMLLRANPGNLQVATQVNPQASYRVEFGFSILGEYNSLTRRSNFLWQGAFQVFDPITGIGPEQGSMAYGWTGSAYAQSNLGEALALVVASGTRPSTTGATFNQPLATNALPQQIVAELYVQNFIGQAPTHTWPPGNGNGNAFDPIPGNALFAPTSFPVA